MRATGSSTGTGELTRRPEKKESSYNANNTTGAAISTGSVTSAGAGAGAGTGMSKGLSQKVPSTTTGGAWGNTFAFTNLDPCAEPDPTTSPITYKYFHVSLSEAAVSTLRLLVNCYPSHPVSHHINDSSMEPRTIYLLGQCGAVELVLRLLTLFVDSVKSRNLVKSRFDKITQQLTKNMRGAGRGSDYRRTIIVEEGYSDVDDNCSTATSDTGSGSGSGSDSVGGATSTSLHSSLGHQSYSSDQTKHTAQTLKSNSTSHTPVCASSPVPVAARTANTATFLMSKHRPSAFAATNGTGSGDAAAATAVASSAAGRTSTSAGGAVTADNIRDTRTIYSALECLYCLSSSSYKHPNRAILEASHTLDHVLVAW